MYDMMKPEAQNLQHKEAKSLIIISDHRTTSFIAITMVDVSPLDENDELSLSSSLSTDESLIQRFVEPIAKSVECDYDQFLEELMTIFHQGSVPPIEVVVVPVPHQQPLTADRPEQTPQTEAFQLFADGSTNHAKQQAEQTLITQVQLPVQPILQHAALNAVREDKEVFQQHHQIDCNTAPTSFSSSTDGKNNVVTEGLSQRERQQQDLLRIIFREENKKEQPDEVRICREQSTAAWKRLSFPIHRRMGNRPSQGTLWPKPALDWQKNVGCFV
jgi:hypothetical protein